MNSGIPVVDIKESIRFVDGDRNFSVNRENYKTVQTPQVFNLKLLKEAYLQKYESSFTDDARVFEAAGNSICLVQGNIENIKITDSFDLETAEKIMNFLSYQ